MNKAWKEKYEDWCALPLKYNFNRTFFLVSVIYCICTFYDLSLTYINYRFNYDGFLKYEFSFAIKDAFNGNPFFCMLMIVFFMLPLIITYGVNTYFVRRYGMQINAIRPVLSAVWFVCFLHIIGGLTNFFYLINI